MTNWQPIETAPKDGSWFLVGGFDTPIGLCFWDLSFVGSLEAYVDDRLDDPTYGFFSAFRGRGQQFLMEDDPTLFWQPLPTPPKQIGER